jgi:hypothetical protein
MNQRAEDLLMGAPSEVTPNQLRELHIGSLSRSDALAAMSAKPPWRVAQNPQLARNHHSISL